MIYMGRRVRRCRVCQGPLVEEILVALQKQHGVNTENLSLQAKAGGKVGLYVFCSETLCVKVGCKFFGIAELTNK